MCRWGCPDLELTEDPWAFYAHLEAVHGPRAIPDTPGGLMERDIVDDVEVVLAVAVGFVIGLVGFGWVALQAARQVVQR